MNGLQKILVVMGIGCFVLAYPLSARADLGIADLYTCPPDYPEDPAFTQHIEQDDIASGKLSMQEVLDVGEILFSVDFNSCDGRGRPATTGGGDKRDPANQPAFTRVSSPDANSCAGCHNEPSVGGGGDFVANVFVLAQLSDPIVESVNGEFSNERNTLGMFGSGAIEMLAREMTAELHAIRDTARIQALASNQELRVELIAKGVSFGYLVAQSDGWLDFDEVEGIDHDLIVKPFHQAGKVISLREFTNNAMNHHHGIQTEERFDLNPAKGVDFDEDGVARELTIGDVTAITLWQAALPVPQQVLPDDPDAVAEIEHGEAIFEAIGCASCHVPELSLNDTDFVEPNPYNPDGNYGYMDETLTEEEQAREEEILTVSFDMTQEGEGHRLQETKDGGAVVRAYTDFKRHNLCDDEIRFLCNEQLDQGRPDVGEVSGTEYFLTRRLWDVGNSAPYGHRGDLTTITEAILVHGGEGRTSRDAFVQLSTDDQRAVINFLKSLQALPEEPMMDDYAFGQNLNGLWGALFGVLAIGFVAVVATRRKE